MHQLWERMKKRFLTLFMVRGQTVEVSRLHGHVEESTGVLVELWMHEAPGQICHTRMLDCCYLPTSMGHFAIDMNMSFLELLYKFICFESV